MSETVQFRMGGYGPSTSSHSRALEIFSAYLQDDKGESIDPKYFWNVMDFDYRADDLLWMVEQGILTLCYFSSSYLSDRVPELNIIDLPFVFDSTAEAHAALDGELGRRLSEKVEATTGYRVLGFWENGFRHLSNRLSPVHRPADLQDMRIRMQPNQTHIETFELLGAIPVSLDLKPGIEHIVTGKVDAQENPLVNTLTYGVADHQKFITMSAHFYGARILLVHKDSFDSWPESLQQSVREAGRKAIEFQRATVAAEEQDVRDKLVDLGCSFVEPSEEERQEFKERVAPVIDKARTELGEEWFDLISN
ncbi:MAG: TRAP transporter substrate-binding protein [Methyloligellaceae bacterium]